MLNRQLYSQSLFTSEMQNLILFESKESATGTTAHVYYELSPLQPASPCPRERSRKPEATWKAVTRAQSSPPDAHR